MKNFPTLDQMKDVYLLCGNQSGFDSEACRTVQALMHYARLYESQTNETNRIARANLTANIHNA